MESIAERTDDGQFPNRGMLALSQNGVSEVALKEKDKGQREVNLGRFCM